MWLCDCCGWSGDESDLDTYTEEDAHADFEQYVCADCYDAIGSPKCPECGELQIYEHF
jgi:hypothetical protein